MIGKWVAEGFNRSLLLQMSRDPCGEERFRKEAEEGFFWPKLTRYISGHPKLKVIRNPERNHKKLTLTIFYRNQKTETPYPTLFFGNPRSFSC